MANVIIADDDDQVRELFCKVLLLDSHEVRQAANGLEAIQLCQKSLPDLVVIDLIMPTKEGLETIRELRLDYPDLRILAISGGGIVGTGSYLHLAEKLGADAVMAKPILPDDLRSAVHRLLGTAPAMS